MLLAGSALVEFKDFPDDGMHKVKVGDLCLEKDVDPVSMHTRARRRGLLVATHGFPGWGGRQHWLPRHS